MEPRYDIEIEPEVRASLGSLPRGHTQWKIPDEHHVDPAYIEAGASIALGQAVYDFRIALGISEAELARRAGLIEAEVEQIEGGGAAPTLPLLRQLTSALDAQLDVSIDSDAMSLAFVPHAA
ncbi:helix-turn-helix transcriptional regulator [Streptomyces flavidovirens]|uniref:Helix-turn-helix domain-containing protein n=1 Tax=Streptomyces flavidovirens TaxID=67298 RepID=A0ABW6R840_9ACTN